MERINEEVLREARGILQKYKDGKKVLEARVREEEKWYRLRHWEVVRGEGDAARPQPTSAWLFNAIMNKHADAMDNFPECSVLPREDGDREDAKTLSAIIPVILERCEFEKVYSYNWWEKLKHGTAIYGSFWNPRLENGLGDVDIKPVDILNIFWEPGIQDIQDSRNVFVLDLRDNDLLEREYPQLEGKLGGDRGLDLPQYEHDLTLDLTGKSAVVDWYYKVRAEDGRTLVHYVKFVGETLLFASEDMDEYADRGFYDHGKYPFVFDALFPEKGTPCGFGYVALCKDPQMYIDKLSQAVLENALRAGKKRWFIGAQTGVNKEQFLDWNKDFVDVEGSANLDDAHMREITTTPLPGSTLNLLQMKVDELKETSSNRDVSSGGTMGGVTAASAITALQEAGNKTSRDMISASYVHGPRNVILLSKYAPPSTLAHELFHELDQGYKISRTFIESLMKDYVALNVKSGGDIVGYLRQKFPEAFVKSGIARKHYLTKQHRGISDIINGLTDGQVFLGYGHKESYWKKADKLEAEAWAQFGRVQFENQADVLKMFQSLFPNFYKSAMIALKELI